MGCECYVCGICVYGGGRSTANFRYILYWCLHANLYVYHSLPILLSCVEVLFCGYLGLKLLFTAMCLTFFDCFVFLCGSVIL